jgi:hypothetical protein
MFLIPNGFRDTALDVTACIKGRQEHAMSSRKLGSALMMKAEFSKIYYIR